MRAKTQKNHSQEWTVCLEGTPLGSLLLTFTANGLAALDFAAEGCKIPAASPPPPNLATLIESVKKELAQYFSGQLVDFKALPLDLQGTPFQQKVWQELQRIPRGRTISYKELARRAGSPQAFRAAGQANAVNPIPIIVPCHRVIAADGSLGGYSSGLERKEWLLKHEGAL
ncbi:MAG: methylated-DNA--[protein]-cysteine S-methyltransferase [Deltaproteobacteria bacterium]|nr:methylated-DNA--[protein]-cysteine S-methyltransferase [Deltaproteobacteria bacterium]